MWDLQPPRHISTLPTTEVSLRCGTSGLLCIASGVLAKRSVGARKISRPEVIEGDPCGDIADMVCGLPRRKPLGRRGQPPQARCGHWRAPRFGPDDAAANADRGENHDPRVSD